MGYDPAFLQNNRKKYKHEEARTQLAIIKYCKIRGFVVGKTKTIGVFQKGVYRKDPYVFKGFPDLTVFCPGLLFVEVKAPSGTQSKEQKLFQELCEKSKIHYILARSLQDFIKIVG